MWLWQAAQPAVRPSHTVAVVSTRSLAYITATSSGMLPPSLVVMLQRWKPVAICCSSVRLGNKSPASCSVVKRSKGRFLLKASITQSR